MEQATFLSLLVGAALLPASANAHVAEGALVLLLPTGHYITAGVAAVGLSIVLICFAPRRFVQRLFTPRVLPGITLPGALGVAISTGSALVLAALIWIGLTGPRDPLNNLLPLVIWTGLWVMVFAISGLLGGVWRWLNPWSGPYSLVMGGAPSPLLRLPERLSAWPAVLTFLVFACFYITDPAPSDPGRLAMVVLCFWGVTFAAMLLFGPEWLERGEAFSVLFRLLALVSPFGDGTRPAIGMPGWALLATPLPASLGGLALIALSTGSFDGLKETFWWLGRIGVNPLEFPGRTAVMGSSLTGLVLASVVLVALFSAVIWAGERCARPKPGFGQPVPFGTLFRRFAPTGLPIALGYHISHFYISFLVGGQYLLAGIGDPLASGANFFGLGDIRVTTGFLNTPASVKAIWLTQAGCVVAGHVLSVLAAHHVALELFETRRRAALSQIPIGIFMALFTLFGLWLLATPRGI